jgi:AcrR family transcriptional regulator
MKATIKKMGLVERAGRGKKRNTRDEILKAAIGLFARKGYHATTLQDIADELGLTRPVFYYYFESKQEILEAICLAASDAADRVIEEGLSLPAANCVDGLRNVLELYISKVALEDSTTIVKRNFEEMSVQIRDTIEQRYRGRTIAVSRLIERGVAAGELEVPEPEIAALLAFEALQASHYWYNGRLTPEQFFKALVQQLLRGLVRSGGKRRS